MDEEISIINSNTRSEKVRNFFVNNKNKIISLIVILVVVLVGAYSFEKYQTNKKRKFQINLIQLLSLILKRQKI